MGEIRRFIHGETEKQLTALARPPWYYGTGPPRRADRAKQFFEADLLDLGTTSGGFKYALTLIDTWSRRAWAWPLTSKQPETLVRVAGPGILEAVPEGATIKTDSGTEYMSVFDDFLEENGILHERGIAYNHNEQAFIERFNGTLRRLLGNVISAARLRTWAQALPAAIDNYNAAVHSSIMTTPSEAHEVKHGSAAWKRIDEANEEARKRNVIPQPNDIRVKQHVRVSTDAFPHTKRGELFGKSDRQRWTREVYKVAGIDRAGDSRIYTVEPRPEYEGRKLQKPLIRRDLLKTTAAVSEEKRVAEPRARSEPAKPIHAPLAATRERRERRGVERLDL